MEFEPPNPENISSPEDFQKMLNFLSKQKDDFKREKREEERMVHQKKKIVKVKLEKQPPWKRGGVDSQYFNLIKPLAQKDLTSTELVLF